MMHNNIIQLQIDRAKKLKQMKTVKRTLNDGTSTPLVYPRLVQASPPLLLDSLLQALILVTFGALYDYGEENLDGNLRN